MGGRLGVGIPGGEQSAREHRGEQQRHASGRRHDGGGTRKELPAKKEKGEARTYMQRFSWREEGEARWRGAFKGRADLPNLARKVR